MESDTWDDQDAYERYVGRWSRAIAETFLSWARVPPDARVVDVGCGTGALSEAILQTPHRQVTGVDASPAYAKAAKARLAGDARASFSTGDAQALDFPDASFDAAVSGLMLNFLAKPEAGAREMRRVTREGGVVAAYVWDYGEGMEMMRRFWDAAVDVDPQRASALDEGVRFPLCRPDRLVALFDEAGLREVVCEPIEQGTRFRDFEDYWTPFLGGQGPAPGYLASLDEAARARLREEVRGRLPIGSDGSITLTARAWAVRGLA